MRRVCPTSLRTTQWRRSLRGDLDNIVAMALRRNPDERYRTAELFAQDLRRYLAHEPVSARPRSLGYVATKFVQRNRAAVASACVVAIALIVAGGFSFWQMIQANEQRRLAEDQAIARGVRARLRRVRAHRCGRDRPSVHDVGAAARAEQALQAYGSADSPVAIEQVIKLGMLFARLGQYRKALQLFENAHARALAGNHAELALAVRLRARSNASLCRTLAAERLRCWMTRSPSCDCRRRTRRR